jgi:hypothetical protein
MVDDKAIAMDKAEVAKDSHLIIENKDAFNARAKARGLNKGEYIVYLKAKIEQNAYIAIVKG